LSTVVLPAPKKPESTVTGKGESNDIAKTFHSICYVII